VPQPPAARITRSNETPRQRSRREAAQVAVGRRIAELREASGQTQAGLAEQLGLSMRYFQSIEVGRANLTIGSLTRIAYGMGVEVIELFSAPTTQARKPGRPRRAPK